MIYCCLQHFVFISEYFSWTTEQKKNWGIFLLKSLNRLEQFIVIMRKATISSGFYAASWKLT